MGSSAKAATDSGLMPVISVLRSTRSLVAMTGHSHCPMRMATYCSMTSRWFGTTSKHSRNATSAIAER